MIVTGELVIDELSDTYSSPACKLGRMVEKGEIIRLRRGLYETDPNTPACLVANYICEPSYISFEYALSWHEIIPERTIVVTNATANKHRNKRFDTPLGSFSYSDVPAAAFPVGVDRFVDDGYEYYIATPAKAVCDKLYKMPPVRSYQGLEALMFDDLRFDEDEILGLESRIIREYAELYHSTTVTTLRNYLEERA